MLFRFLFPAIYVLLVLLFFAFLIIGGGHGKSPFEFVFYLAFPVGFLLYLLPASWVPADISLLFLFVLAGLVQWVLVGYLIDKLIARLRKKSSRPLPHVDNTSTR